MNQLYQMLMQNSPAYNALSLLQQFSQFRSNFRGNAQEQIQQMLQSGQITQDQYNMAVQKAQQLSQFLPK
jgi:hypothetical protein